MIMMTEPKTKTGASPKTSARRSPQNGANSGVNNAPGQGIFAKAVAKTVGETSKALEETMGRASALAGCTIEEFKHLPRSEKNDFLAQASSKASASPVAIGKGELKILDPKQCARSPWNRKHFNAQKRIEMIESIKEHGVIQPGVVRPWRPETIAGKYQVEDAPFPMYELVCGERRWDGCMETGEPFPAMVRELTDKEAIKLQALENIQREDPNPIETAEKIHQLIELYAKDGVKGEDAIKGVMEDLQMKRTAVYDGLRLLKLPEKVKNECLDGLLPASHAGLIAKLEQNPEILEETFRMVMNPLTVPRAHWEKLESEGGILSFRDTKKLVEKMEAKIENLKNYNQNVELFQKEGWKILTEAEVKKCVSWTNEDGSYGLKTECPYLKETETCQLPGAGYKDFGKLWKKAPPRVLIQLANGAPAFIYEKSAAIDAVKNGGKLKKIESGRVSSRSADEIAREKALIIRKAVFVKAREKMVVVESMRPDSEAFWRLYTGMLARQSGSLAWQALAKRRGWTGKDRDQLPELTKGMTIEGMRAVALELVMCSICQPSMYDGGWDKDFLAACRAYKVDPKAIAAEVQASGSGKRGKQ